MSTQLSKKSMADMSPTEKLTYMHLVHQKLVAIVKKEVDSYTLDQMTVWCREIKERFGYEDHLHVNECIRLEAKRRMHEELDQQAQQEAAKQPEIIRMTTQIMVEVELTGTSEQIDEALKHLTPLADDIRQDVGDQMWTYVVTIQENEDFYDGFTVHPTGKTSYTFPQYAGQGVS